jgi:mannitol-specific phosphotransferase system IIBC component
MSKGVVFANLTACHNTQKLCRPCKNPEKRLDRKTKRNKHKKDEDKQQKKPRENKNKNQEKKQRHGILVLSPRGNKMERPGKPLHFPDHRLSAKLNAFLVSASIHTTEKEKPNKLGECHYGRRNIGPRCGAQNRSCSSYFIG